MKRDLRKTLESYKRRYEGKAGKEGAFYVSDLDQIRAFSVYGEDREYDLIDNSLKIGFMIGYRKAQRDGRTRSTATEATDPTASKLVASYLSLSPEHRKQVSLYLERMVSNERKGKAE